ncbi:MAG: hypothetical protein M1836_002767 [Candelina mexicana]|nr:MAG: hypothetical protein M1836_002767 [Candelina mexicana]
MADEPGQPPAMTQQSLASQAPDLNGTAQSVTPFDVQGGTDKDGRPLAIDYNKLVNEFQTKLIDNELLARFERLTGRRPHRLMRRKIVFSHRELDQILDRYEKKEPFFLYTGRGPSSDSMHIGHVIPFEFTKYLQEVFDVPLVIMLTDDEKYLFNPKFTIEDVQGFTRKNAKDIIAVGFNPKKTFIFSDLDYMGGAFYHNVVKFSRTVTVNQSKGAFGHNDSSNIGIVQFPAIQSVAAFATSFPSIFGSDPSKSSTIPCLIPCAIDQDVYFRMTRDHAFQLKYPKPALIHCVFLPALQGSSQKMSASKDHTSIFMNDEPNKIKNKVNRHAFSGGQDTREEHKRLGGRTELDVSFQYLKFFLEDDDELEIIRQGYESGELETGSLKARCIKELQIFVKEFQERKAKVTDELLDEFMTARKLDFPDLDEFLAREVEKPAESKAAKKKKEKVIGTGKPSADNVELSRV